MPWWHQIFPTDSGLGQQLKVHRLEKVERRLIVRLVLDLDRHEAPAAGRRPDRQRVHELVLRPEVG